MGLLFWRKKGRHALGAAVTSLPTGPISAALPPALAPLVEPVEPAAPAASATEPDLMSSIAELIATGEAWTEPGERPARAERARAVLPPVDRAEPVSPAVPVAEAPSAAPVLLAEPVAPAVPAQPAPVPAALPRVQLGFRDGTSTSLDPQSQQSLALEQIAQSLTRRD